MSIGLPPTAVEHEAAEWAVRQAGDGEGGGGACLHEPQGHDGGHDTQGHDGGRDDTYYNIDGEGL